MRRLFTWFIPVLLLTGLVLVGCSLPTALTQTASAPAPVAAAAQPTVTSAPPVTSSPAPVSASNSASLLAALQGTLENIYQQVSPSVVTIRVVEGAQTSNGATPQIPGFPFSGPQGPQVQQALGSGFVWDTQGDIVTNNHVVAGATSISVTFSDGTTVSGKVVGADPASDLAVVKVNVPASELHPVQVIDSSQVKVGQLAIAIGNPFGEQNTMTTGIVSALGRYLPVNNSNVQGPTYTIPDIIQTDAPINPGNSGGVLVDDQGRLIGVTAAIESPSQASAGVGFAIPSAIVEKVVPVLIKTGQYEHTWLGISGTSLTPELAQAMNLNSDQRGALVVDVVPGSPADKAGLHGSDRQVTINGQNALVGGDVITAINGQPVKSFEDLVAYLALNTEVGQTVNLTVLRQGQEETLQVTLEARPNTQTQQAQTAQGVSGGAWLGIAGVTVTPEIAQAMNLSSGQQGVLVERVDQGSPADQAGLQGSYQAVVINGQNVLVGGDVIVALDGQPVSQVQDLQAFLQQAQPGQKVTLSVLRAGKQLQVDVTLGEPPASTP